MQIVLYSTVVSYMSLTISKPKNYVVGSTFCHTFQFTTASLNCACPN